MLKSPLPAALAHFWSGLRWGLVQSGGVSEWRGFPNSLFRIAGSLKKEGNPAITINWSLCSEQQGFGKAGCNLFSEVSLCATGNPAELLLPLYLSFFWAVIAFTVSWGAFSVALLDSAAILAAPTLPYERTLLQNRPWAVCFAFDILDS